ncbi:DUF58 domain-containing protein [Clostridium sp. BJN0001]|uniref:DUF58 domain-containing protein n=1 Tax=Clostridium sp. BJN0001 TaxID=2930219 RepID=UPI001FD3353D|nr:DUF58 domain-containing protein [Clostridium sp. BJN0001]
MGPILIMFIVYLIYSIQYKFYESKAFNNLDVDLKFDNYACFCGEDVTVSYTFTNKKWLPLWWIKIQYTIDNINESSQFSLLGYERLKETKKLHNLNRGCYKIGNVDVLCSDLFVTNKFVKKTFNNSTVYVFPRLIDSSEFNIEFNKLLGTVVSRRQIVNDQYEIKGIRDYSSFDSFKDINWSATARTNELKTNIYNYTSKQDIIIFLSLNREDDWVSSDVIEEAISLAASIYNKMAERMISVSVITDAWDTEAYKNIEIVSSLYDNPIQDANETFSKINIKNLSEKNICYYIDREIKKCNTMPLYFIISNNTRNGIKDVYRQTKMQGIETRLVIPKEKQRQIFLDGLEDAIVWDVDL